MYFIMRNLRNVCRVLEINLAPQQTFEVAKCFCSKQEENPLITLRWKENSLKKKILISRKLKYTNSIIYGPIIKSKVRQPTPTEDAVPLPQEINLLNRKAKKKKINTDYSLVINTNYSTIEENKETEAQTLFIDNSNYNLVPSQLNRNYIETFPLFKSATEQNVLKENAYKEIKTINMFEGGYKKLPSVRTILTETMPLERKAILERWEKKMIKQMGEDGFQNYRQGLFHKGQILHECVDATLRSGEDPLPEQLVGIEESWTSIKHTIPKLSDVKIIESRVIHPHLHYQGVIDCVATYRDSPVVIEFKTSTKPKLTVQSMFDDPLQLIAYLGALNYDSSYDSLQINGALLVVAYPTGLPAHCHFLTKDHCEMYWNMWRQRVRQFWEINAKPSPANVKTVG